MSIAAMKQALEALELGQDAFSQTFGGYGYYRPDNPHNFFPDPECCTEKEIAYHSAACEAYDKGTYVPDHSDGWITPELHVTKAPWGIGTYTDECKEITEAIAALRAALQAAEKQEPVATVCYSSLHGISIENHAPDILEAGMKLYTHPQPIPEWQPIETAPKDGRYLMVGNEDGVWVACYTPIFQSGFRPDNPWISLMLNHRHIEKVKRNYSSVPTHWMPLPDAPKEKS